MIKENHTLLTIGQFAKLHEINKKTLMWYDEIGLLKPYCIKENGYRYYSYQQSSTLETILLLRELNMSLEEIAKFMKNRTMNNLDFLLSEKVEELEQRISHLKSVQKILQNHQSHIKTLQSLDLSSIRLVQKESCYLIAVDTEKNGSFEQEIEKVIEKVKKYQLRRLHDASYGSMIPVENLYHGKLTEYTSLYIEMPYPISKEGLHLQPSGTYLRAFCKGNWNKLPDKYREILSFAEQNNLSLYGFAYEMGINELVIDNVDDYITQIEIPVKIEK